MIKDCNKYIVVHSGKRDAYKVAESLYEANQLGFLVTDDYVFRYLLKKEKSIPLSNVKTSFRAVFWLILYKIFKNQFFQVNKDRALSLTAAQLANRHNFSLLAYSYYALPAFDIVKKSITKILFQLHPHPKFIKNLFLEEIGLIPESKKSLSLEHELNDDVEHFNQLNLEATKADMIICASSFTEFTLKQENINKKIIVIPYGVNLNDYPFYTRKSAKKAVFNILFVGSLNQRKGIYYLLEAVQKLQIENYDVQLTIVGRGIFDIEIMNLFNIKDLNIKYNVSFEELINSYKSADVFVLPSLCEGFAQVILEAMSTGLPVISTNHTSAQDLIENGVDGFVIPIRSSEAIFEKIIFLMHNIEERLKMGNLAFLKSKNYTWQTFKSKLIETLNGN
ncbi:glycosyltransferase family 4 protein [Flavobacterium sp. LB1P62]|uniref:glycosyltransferase family 4 protein n=1 Tax=Flavobacterium sp. LB1P62 TaxID=3401715 RepID=UPI003AAAC78F